MIEGPIMEIFYVVPEKDYVNLVQKTIVSHMLANPTAEFGNKFPVAPT